MSARPPRPPTKQFTVRRRASDKELLNISVISVMNPSKSEKTLFWPEDTAFENPIETVPMKPEDYELPLL